MGFTILDRHLINCLPQVCATCLWTINRQLNIDGMILLNKKNWHDWQYQAV